MTHINRIHGEFEKQFECTYCEKAFITSSELILHVRTHTGEKPYLCSRCPASFSHSSNLRGHSLALHGDGDLRPHACQLCDKRFKDKTGLGHHVVKHLGRRYKCKLCEKTFTSKGHLK